MTVNMLKMNRDKTELLVLNGRQRPLPPLTTISVCDEEINRSTKARNVGVIYDSSLSMENHIMAMVWFAKGIAKEITARSKCCSQDCYA